MKKPQKLLFYFAFRSPYSWMGWRLLEQRIPDAYQRITYIPYWDPDEDTLLRLRAMGGDYLYTPMSKAKHLYILMDTKRLASKFGYPMVWPIDSSPWWDLPNLAYLAACRLGKGHEFLQAVYRARWEKAEDICRPETIGRLAIEVGLDAETLVKAPENEEIRMSGAKALYQAFLDDVFGIPYFKCGQQRFWGVDRLEDFVNMLPL